MAELEKVPTSEEIERMRTEAHKAMKRNRHWLWESDNGHLICRCKRCGCGHIVPFYAYENPYHFCHHCGLATDPRVLTREEALNQTGHGWVELWFEPDEVTGEPDYKELMEGAWCKGCYILGDADISTSDYTASFYGKKFGVRFWTAKPTEAEREAAAWLSS